MRLRRLPWLPLLAALPLTIGCLDSGEMAQVSSESVELRCGSTGCGVNGPDTDGHGFGELNTSGAINQYGYYIYGAMKSGKKITLTVENNELVGKQSGATLTGSELIGTSIKILHNRQPHYWTLRVMAHDDDTHYWLGDQGETIPSYLFAVGMDGGVEDTLCNHEAIEDDENVNEAFVFEGDRYDRIAKTVSDDSLTSGWFNIACTGSTANKLLRLRHAKIAADGEIATEPGERQAVYKAIVGDFCGEGESLTETGVPLFTRLAVTWGWDWNFGCWITGDEAIWDATGALCVDTYRLADDPEMAEKLAACGIPDCSADDHEAYEAGEYGWMRTSNPLIPPPDGNDECEMFHH